MKVKEAEQILKWYKQGRIDLIKKMAQEALDEKVESKEKKNLSEEDRIKEKFLSARKAGYKGTIEQYKHLHKDKDYTKLTEAYNRDRLNGMTMPFEEYIQEFGEKILKG